MLDNFWYLLLFMKSSIFWHMYTYYGTVFDILSVEHIRLLLSESREAVSVFVRGYNSLSWLSWNTEYATIW